MAAPGRRAAIVAKAACISPVVRASRTSIWSFSARVTSAISLVRTGWEAFVGLARTATRASPGTASFSSSTCLPASSVPTKLRPVTFPPGRAKLATRPVATGSAGTVMTMGTVVVTCFAASAVSVLETTMTSTLRRTSSSTTARFASIRSPACRRSMTMFRCSAHPCSRKPATNTSEKGEPGTFEMYPILRRAPAGCASARRVAAGRLSTRPLRNARRSIGRWSIVFMALVRRDEPWSVGTLAPERPASPGRRRAVAPRSSCDPGASCAATGSGSRSGRRRATAGRSGCGACRGPERRGGLSRGRRGYGGARWGRAAPGSSRPDRR
jgi:hypothetical protein